MRALRTKYWITKFTFKTIFINFWIAAFHASKIFFPTSSKFSSSMFITWRTSCTISTSFMRALRTKNWITNSTFIAIFINFRITTFHTSKIFFSASSKIISCRLPTRKTAKSTSIILISSGSSKILMKALSTKDWITNFAFKTVLLILESPHFIQVKYSFPPPPNFIPASSLH